MSPATGDLAQRLVELRDGFDRSFAELPHPAAEFEDLLGVRVGGVGYAVRLSAISGLFADRAITPLPGSPPEFLGLAGFRGSVVPVYDLGAVLGHPGSATPRWLVLASGVPAVGLAFDGVDGHLRIARDQTGEVVRAPAGLRPVIDVPAVRAAISAVARAVAQNRM